MPKENPAYRDHLEALMKACNTTSPVCFVGATDIGKLCNVSRSTVIRNKERFGLVGTKTTLVNVARALSAGTHN